MDFPDIVLQKDEPLAAARDRVLAQLKESSIEAIELSQLESEFVKCLAIFKPPEVHVFILSTQSWTDDMEVDVFSRLHGLWQVAASESHELLVHVSSAYPLPDHIQFWFSDIRRTFFWIEAGKDTRGKELSAKTVREHAISGVVLLKKYYGDWLTKNPISLETIDKFILSILRNQTDMDKPNEGDVPTFALTYLGCAAGELMREKFLAEQSWKFKWVDDGTDVLLEYGILESKGFFRSEYRHIISINPINKTHKLFKYGSGDRVEPLYRGSVAAVKDYLAKRNK